MKTLFLLLLATFALDKPAVQELQGSWVITTPCDCPDRKEITWKTTFKADGTYDVDIDVDDSVDITGRYWLEGNTLTVQNDKGCTAKGIYTFTIEGDKLWMDPIEDGCEGRKPPQKVYFTKA